MRCEQMDSVVCGDRIALRDPPECPHHHGEQRFLPPSLGLLPRIPQEQHSTRVCEMPTFLEKRWGDQLRFP